MLVYSRGERHSFFFFLSSRVIFICGVRIWLQLTEIEFKAMLWFVALAVE